MTHKPGKQIVAEFFAAVGRGDLEAVMGFFTDDSVYTVVGDPTGTPPLDAESKKAIPWLGRYHGPEGAKQFIGQLKNNIEVIGFGPQEIVDGGEKIAVFGSFSYRAASTGRQFDSDYAIRIVLKDGKFAEYWFYENTYAVAAAFRTSGCWTQAFGETEQTVP